MELADETRRVLEGLKSFDIVHELRMINMEKDMDCPGTCDTQDMIIEKFKAFHGNLFSVIEGLFGMVINLEAQLKAHVEAGKPAMPTLMDILDEMPLQISEAGRMKMVSQTEPDVESPAVLAGNIVYIDFPTTDL